MRTGQPVTFRVDAYPTDRFHGTVHQIRLLPTTVQNVVTNSTVISEPNPDYKLKPGMTGDVTIEIARRDNVLRAPAAALRFRPSNDVFAALKQEVPPSPGQKTKLPMPIPLKIALFGAQTGEKHDDRLFMLDGAEEEMVIQGVNEPVVLSVNRDFSAPVIIETDRDATALAFLSARDDDPFARYEAMQQLMLDTLTAGAGHGPVVDAVRETLANQALAEFAAQAVARSARPRTSRETPAATARLRSIAEPNTGLLECGATDGGRATVGATALAEAEAGIDRRTPSAGRPRAEPTLRVAATQNATAPGKTRFSKV
jgi:hypothetical protein